MAFEVFNFGKQLGIVGDNSTKQNEPVSYTIEVPVVETETWTGGGGYWRQGSPTYVNIPEDSNPIEWGGTWLPGPWIWNDGPDLRSTRTRTVPGTYRPWEVPKVVNITSQSSADHPYWKGGCDGSNRQWCSKEYIDEVVKMVMDLLYPITYTRIYNNFYPILECMRKSLNTHLVRFGCCPDKPLPNDEFNDEAWRRQILDYGVAWLDPNKLPTITELLKALTQPCEGNDGKQREYVINDITAYLLSGEKPPCYLLQGMLDNVSESARSRPYSTFDKYFSWDPRTGKIYWRNPDGTRGEQANTGEESNWKCRGPVRESDGLYRYNCCG